MLRKADRELAKVAWCLQYDEFQGLLTTYGGTVDTLDVLTATALLWAELWVVDVVAFVALPPSSCVDS